MKNDATDELHVKMTHVQNTFAGFPYDSECLWQKFLERFSICEALFEFGCFGSELVVVKGGNLVFQLVDLQNERLDLFNLTSIVRTYTFLEERIEHRRV